MIGLFISCVTEMVTPSGRKRQRSTPTEWVVVVGMFGAAMLFYGANTNERLIGGACFVFLAVAAALFYWDRKITRDLKKSPPPHPLRLAGGQRPSPRPDFPRRGPNRERPMDRPYPWRTWEG